MAGYRIFLFTFLNELLCIFLLCISAGTPVFVSWFTCIITLFGYGSSKRKKLKVKSFVRFRYKWTFLQEWILRENNFSTNLTRKVFTNRTWFFHVNITRVWNFNKKVILGNSFFGKTRSRQTRCLKTPILQSSVFSKNPSTQNFWEKPVVGKLGV